MTEPVYTAITFAPVQGFIEKSRKLRDLYGSSYILSRLADQVCEAAREQLGPEDPVISPALIDVAQGTPNQIVIRGLFPAEAAEAALQSSWRTIVSTCREWIEAHIQTMPNGEAWTYYWHRPWQNWANHAWEFFWAYGATIDAARENLNNAKLARCWTGVNWVGESSTLSGLDSRAWPMLGYHSPHTRSKHVEEREVQAFYRQLSEHRHIQTATISPQEQLSIPELVKRLVTIESVASRIDGIELPKTFKELNRKESSRWTGWFHGDGDRAGNYLRGQSDTQLHEFSYRMRQWGRNLQLDFEAAGLGRIVYAGGDDFLGVFYHGEQEPDLQALDCFNGWFYRFRQNIWTRHEQPISVSVGFVWTAPGVPQRDVLQQCREAESSAKRQGRDRVAIRTLFNDGKYLEWVCPWRFLPVLQDYSDRSGQQNWTHFYNDVATLEARHAFGPPAPLPLFGQSQPLPQPEISANIALALLKLYLAKPEASADSAWDTADRDLFYEWLGTEPLDLDHPVMWNLYTGSDRYDSASGNLESAGLLGDRRLFLGLGGELERNQVNRALNSWVINLAKVGFQLHQERFSQSSAVAASSL